MASLDDTTWLPPKRTPDARSQSQLVLTLLCHPDPSRVGERVLLDGVVDITRHSPVFCSAEGSRTQPLEDRFISRKPLRITQTRHGATLEGATAWTLNGSAHTEVTLSSEQLLAGVVLGLAGRVLMLLQDMQQVSKPIGLLLGPSPALQRVRDRITAAAATTATVLITGESGVGKELVAQSVHEQSARSDGPFVAVNLAATRGDTAAAELFGHARGAFTGAYCARDGWFAEAHGGTLFLDEVGDAGLDVQAMLLRALETGVIRPVGGAERTVDVRVVAATDADLTSAAAQGRFREPLLYRLRGWHIDVPPLRTRADDIALLAVRFLQDELHAIGSADCLAPTRGRDPMWLSTDWMAALLAHPWPGNVRELRQVARQVAIASCHEAVAQVPDTLQMCTQQSASSTDIGVVYRQHGFRIGTTAKALGISRNTLYARLDELGIQTAKDLSKAQIDAAVDAHGTLFAAATALGVSERSLKLRITAMERES